MADGDFILSEEDRAKLRERMGQVEDTRRDLTDQRNAIVETDSPDDAAYDLKRSKELGIPRAAVGGDRDGHKVQQKFEELNRLAEEAPKSRRWLAEPDNYAIARDEVKDISLMEKLMAAGSSVMYWGASDFGEALPDVAKASPAKFKQQYYGTLQQQQEMAGAYQRELDAWKARRKPIFSDGQVDIGAFNARLFGQQKKPGAPLALKMVGLGADDSYSELGRKAAMGLLDKDAQQSAYQARKALEEFQAKMPQTGDFVTDSALSGVSSLINMLPMIGMAIATKSPNAPSVLMGGQVQGESYARAREEGLSPLEADQYAGSQAAIEVAMERVGLGVIFKNLEDGAPLVRQFLEGQTTEQVQEQITTVLQDFVDWQTFNPEKTIAEFAAERPEAAAQTAIATLVASGAMQGSIIGADALMTSESDRQARVKNTEAQQRVSKIFDAANRLKTLQRSPEAAVNLLDEITGDTDVETVTIDLDGIGPALEEAGIDPLEALIGLGLDDAALKQAYDLGGEIEVRTSALLTSPLMRDNRAQIEPHVRHNADEYTPAKREAAEAELETEIQNIVAEGRKGLEDAGSSMEADDQVRDLVTQRLQQGGAEYAQQDVANAEIELMTAMNNTLARALGRDPVEFFNERFPDVKASLSEEQGADGVVSEGREDRSARHKAEREALEEEFKDVHELNKIEDQVAATLAKMKTGNVSEAARALLPEREAKLKELESRKAEWEKRHIELLARQKAERDAGRQGVEVLQQAQTNGYEGQDLEGAQEWEAARAKGLDMSPPARTARRGSWQAEVDTPADIREVVFYHGSDADIKEFWTPLRGKTAGTGVFLTSDIAKAGSYASEQKGKIYPVHVRGKNIVEIDVGGRNWSDIDTNDVVLRYPDGTDDKAIDVFALDANSATTVDELAAAARETGLDGVMFTNVVDSGGNVHLQDSIDYLKSTGLEIPTYPDGSPKLADVPGNLLLAARDHVEAKSRAASDTLVIFDPANIRSVNAAFDPDMVDSANLLSQQARGTFSPTRNLVTLFDQRNASTLMHELSHWYLTELHNMAAAENAPAFVKKQYEEVLRWARVPYDFQMFDENGVITDQGREVQESFAETFEAYLRDGKAPTAALRDAFRVFKRWITAIYRRLTGPERANLTPEIRSVMDRMVASEDAIEAASKPVETLADQQAKAMLDAGIITEKQYDNFRKRIESARESAKEDLLQVLMQQHLREGEGWWRDERKRVKGDLTREFDRSQVGRAWNWLAGQGWKGDVPDAESTGENEFYQEVPRNLAAMMDLTTEQMGEWYVDNVTETRQELGDGFAIINLQFKSQEGLDRPDAHVNLKLDNGKVSADMYLRGKTNAETSLKEATPAERRERVAEANRVFTRASMVLKHWIALEQPPAVVFSGSSTAHNRLYGYLLSRAVFEGYTNHQISSIIGTATDRDGVTEGDTFIGQSEKFVILKEGQSLDDFADTETEKTRSGRDIDGNPWQGVHARYAREIGPVGDANLSDERGRLPVGRDGSGRGGDLYQLTQDSPAQIQARLDRAERQGFKIKAFRGQALRQNPNLDHDTYQNDEAIIGGGWFASTSEAANTYAEAPNIRNYDTMVMEARIRLRNPLVVDMGGAAFNQVDRASVPDHVLDSLPKSVRKEGGFLGRKRKKFLTQHIAHAAALNGHDGVIFENMLAERLPESRRKAEPATVYVVFDAKDIRSAFAAFDDAKSEEAGLLNQRGDPKGWGETSPPPDLPPIRLDLSAVREDYGEDAVRRLPRAIRERSGAGSSVTDMLETIRGVRKTLKRKPPKSLSDFIRSKGKQGTISSPGARGPNGIKDSGPELKTMGLENLINETSGMDIDYVREMAAEVGYLEDGATINDLLDALDRESRGDPVYRAEDMAQAEDIGNAEAWQSWLSEGGVDIFETNDKVLRKQVSDFVTQNGEGAMSPDDAAELLGFTSGEALLKALAEVGSRERYLNELTRREMNREFGNMMEDGTLEMEARQMAEAELVSRHAEIELEALARAVGEVAAGRMAKQMAKDALALMTVKEIRANGRFLQAERREMRNALDATRKGDYAQAFIHKRRQLVNMHLYNEARKAADKLEKHRRDLQKYETSESRRKSIAPDYREKIDALLEAYELRVSKQGPKEQRNRLSAAQWVLEMTEQGRESEITPEAFLLAQAAEDKVWSTLTLEEAEYLVATVANMAHLGKLKERLLNEREKRAFSAVVDGLVERLVAAPTNKDREQNVSATVGERTATWLRKAHARLTRMEFQFARLDGGENGALFNALWRPMAEAADRETVMARDGAEKMNALYEAYSPRERGRLFSQRVDTPELQWPGKKSPTRMDVITVGLNWGNEGNRSALLEGYGWDEAAVETMLNRVLTDKDWDFIEGTWALIGEYRDPAFALEKKITGVAPKAVEGVTFTLASGREIKGQYYPLKYSTDAPTPKAVTQQRLEEKDMLADLGKTYSKPMTKTGHLKERVGSGGKRVKLSISVFHEHVQNVIHDINYRPAVIDAHKIIQNERFAQAYINAAGREQYDMLRPWIAAVATERAEEPGGFVTDIMQRARRNFSIVAMGYKIGTATQQLTGILAAPALIGTKYTTQGFLKAFGGNPASFWGSWQWVSEKSEFMRDRPQGFDRDVRMVTNKMQERTPLGKMQRNAFIFIGMMDTAVSTGAWIGAYDKAMDGKVKGIEASNEEDAIVYADSVIRRTQVAGRMQDLPQIMRGTELEKLMTSVYSYFSGLYNLTAAQIQDVRGGQVHPAAFAANMSLLFVVIPMLAEVLAGRFPPPDDEDEPGEKAAKALVSNAVSTVPFLRDIVNAGMNPQFGYNMSPAGSIIDRGVQGVARAADGIESEYEARLALDSLGVLFGLPTGQLWITGEYAYGVATGEEDPSENPADALREAALKDTR